MTDGLDMLDDWLERIKPIDLSDQSIEHRDFADEVRERMKQGRRSYGDKSFSLPFSTLIYESQQEAIDLAGWPYMAWRQLRQWEAKLKPEDELRVPLERAMECLETIGWHASLTWTRMGRLVTEVMEMQQANNDHEQDGA